MTKIDGLLWVAVWTLFKMVLDAVALGILIWRYKHG